jgi:molybdopterin-guanine dinucleotide biosynthesis protein A
MEAMRSAVILAGGAGRRLGEDKSLIEFGGRSLIQWSVEKLARVVDEIVLVARDPEQAGSLGDLLPDILVSCDGISGYGPVAGLAAGMECGQGENALAVGCDLPFLNTDVVLKLFELVEGYEAAVPVRANGMIEPLHAVYKREKLLTACKASIEQGERRIRSPLAMLNVNYVSINLLKPLDPELLTFFNLNTREDLETARKMWSGSCSLGRSQR